MSDNEGELKDKYNFAVYDVPHILEHLSVRIGFYADLGEVYGFSEIQESKCFLKFLMKFWWLLKLYTGFLKKFGR